MNDVFTARGLSASYGRRKALHGLSFNISKGECVALIGPNGAGKSTLLRLLAGILSAPPGSLFLNGVPFEKLNALRIARELSFVGQFAGTVPPYTVEDFVAMGLFPYRKPFQVFGNTESAQVKEALSLCSLENLKGRELGELSGGELQLVFIAKALTQNRSLILLDEPVSHLDAGHIIAVMDILNNINKAGGTVVVSFHDLNLALSQCSRVIALKDGKIFFDGSPPDVVRPELVSGLYETPCFVDKNPVTGKPFVWFANSKKNDFL